MYIRKNTLQDPIFANADYIGKYCLPYEPSMNAKRILWDPNGTMGIVAGQEPDYIDFNTKYNKEIALWMSSDGNTYAMLCTVTALFLYPYPMSANAKPYVPNVPTGGIKNTKPQDPTCPCDCKEVTKQVILYVHKSKQANDDIPITIQNKKIVCESKQTGKKYAIDCNDNMTIESQINQLNGLSSGNIATGTPIGGGTSSGGAIANNGSAPCPCDCKDILVNEQWYLSKVQSNIPMKVNVTQTECTTTDKNNRKIDCNGVNTSIQNSQLNDLNVGQFVKDNETEIAVGIAAATLFAIIFVVS